MHSSIDVFKRIYCSAPLREAPLRYAESDDSPYRRRYRQTLLDCCPRGGRALETGIGSAFDSIYLSLRGVEAFGIDIEPAIVERANHLAGVLDSTARFSAGDLFNLYDKTAPRWDLIHHSNTIEHYSARRMRAALAQQVCMANRVILGVVSMFYPYDPLGRELFWPLSELEHHLSGFDVELLEYYGDPNHGEREHILCVLRGQEMNAAMRAIIAEADAPFEPGITAIVVARNEEAKLPCCLEALRFCTSVVIGDMSSSDRTKQIGLEYGATVVTLDHLPVFDFIRNILAQRAKTEFCIIVDADEIVPSGMAEDLLAISSDGTANFAGMLLPFRHYMGNHWLKMLGPGYTAARLVRTGMFHFNKPLHGGVELFGRTAYYPASDPNKMIEHRTNDHLTDYLTKQNIYTSSEADTELKRGKEYSFVDALLGWLHDLVSYHDQTTPSDDGPWRLIYSVCGANYRFYTAAKLFEARYNAGLLKPHELRVPGSVAEILSLLTSALNQRPALPPPPVEVSDSADAAYLVASAPFEHFCGIGEEARSNFVAITRAGILVRARNIPWGHDKTVFAPKQVEFYDAACSRLARPGFVHLIQDLGNWERLPGAGATIARFMYETDRLPTGVPQQLNRLDRVIVPSEFNLRTFVDSGVDPVKLCVVPSCIDPEPYISPRSSALADDIRSKGRYTFLAIGEMSLRKGFDTLLVSWLRAFEGRTDVQLVIKTWSASVPYTPDQIIERLGRFAYDQLNVDISGDDRIRIVTDDVPRAEMPALYAAVDAFVLATRGEGVGRPLMEAMAAGKPTIATGGTGNTAFMHGGNSWLVDYDWVAVPPALYAEVPAYKGHRCVEIRPDHLIETMRYVIDNPGEAEACAMAGRAEIADRFNPQVVGKLWEAALAPFLDAVGAVHASAHPAIAADNDSESTALSTSADHSGAQGKIARAAAVHGRAASRRAAKLAKLPGVKPAADVTVMSPCEVVTHRPLGRPINIRCVGEFFVWHSLGLVNREVVRRFAVDPDMKVSIIPLEQPEFGPEYDPRLQVLVDRTCAPLEPFADFEFRHHYPPRFNRPADPRTKLIVIAPWEYYSLPEAWIKPIIESVTEVWAYSEAVKQCYADSGVPAEMIRVISLGVDTGIFRPDAPPYQFTDEPGAQRLAGFDTPPTIFLAVGTIDRKNPDTLIEAYCNTFSKYDNVVLVVKDTCVNTVYRGGTQGERLKALANSPTGPAIIYIENELPPATHAGLFRRAHLVVLPYTNEGFCLPALEAQASGTPPCVPAGGPTSDFCNASNAIIVPAKLESTGSSRVGEWWCCGNTSKLVIDPRDLGRAMRYAHEHHDELEILGQAGLKNATENLTWDHTVAQMKERLVALAEQEYTSTQEGRKEGTQENRERSARDLGSTGSAASARSGARSPKRPIAKIPAAASPAKPILKVVSGAKVTDRRSSALAAEKVVHVILRNRPEICCAMITRNEERCIGESVSSVKPHCPRVYIIDTGSTDNTVEICRDLGCVVVEKPWPYSFSVARNWSLDLAADDRAEFTYWQDADDCLPGECGEGMLRLVAAAEDRVCGFIMQVHIPPGPGEQGTTIVDHLKLMRNRNKPAGKHNYQFEGRIHEQLLESIYREGGIVQKTNLYTVHRNYDRSVAGQQKKRERDEYLLRLDEEERPLASFPRFNSGMSYSHWGEYDLAIQKFQECIERASPRESTMRKVYALLSGCHLAKRDYDGARKAIDTGLALTPNDPESLFRAANLAHTARDLPAAERYFLRLFNNRESGHIDSLDVSIYGEKGHHNAAALYIDMGRLPDAEAHFREALRCNNYFTPSYAGLTELYLRQRRFSDAADVIARLEPLDAALAEALRQRLAAAQSTHVI